MSTPLQLTLQIIFTVLAGISAQVLAEFLKIPGIVLLLLFGIALGPSGLSIIHPSSLGDGLEVIVALLVAIILFEGGFNLRLQDIDRVSSSLRNLVTLGTLITLLGGGMAAHWLGEFPWSISFLYASLVVVTGPTVINSLLKQVEVDRQVSTLLEGEGVLIDPVGAILSVVVLNVVLSGGNPEPLVVLNDLLLRVGIGAAIGVSGGWLMGVLLKQATFLSEELKTLVVLAGVWGWFGLAQLLRSEAGLMAAVTSGIVLRALEVPQERLLKRFKSQLTVLSVSVLFILLSADLSIAGVFALGWGGVFTVLALMFIVRPIGIWLCTWQDDLNWRQKLFMSWIAPRGIVSASVASLFSILLTQGGINGGDSVKALVFLTIILTVFLQSLTAQPIAKLLGITSQEVTGAVIVGSHPLSALLARFFLERGETVTVIDTAPDPTLFPPQENLKLLTSTALDTAVLEEAGLAAIGTFLAMTDNGEVNAVLAQRAAEEFQPPRVLAVFPREGTTANGQVSQAFSTQASLKTWNEYLQNDAVRLGETILHEGDFEGQRLRLLKLIGQGELLPLLLDRKACLQVIPAELEFKVGDRITYLLHDPRPKLLKRLSGATQPRLMVEKLPDVEGSIQSA
ncbi:sodium:proton antiporter [Alkalinema sp. FACHB-956]|uniref:cation:proton antiporter n=1 Tax=Alkalinema sp. FACHB-956 TaxID=2692768 RepID=UPI0016852772|nr:sodium:proton antiporter [Alkalinema sp. FACHB-956]MBD2328314.1 cation:proton antiporter [Alkalinema sp. FACHB-956]